MTTPASSARHPRWPIVQLALAVAALVALWPSGLGAQEAGPDADLIADGRALYGGIGLCFACHGPSGKGVPGAGVDLTDREWLHSDGSVDGILNQVLIGVGPGESRSGVIMLPKGGSTISETQARAIAAYVWSLSTTTND